MPASSSSYLTPLGRSTTTASFASAGCGSGGRLLFLPPHTPVAFFGLWALAAGPGRRPAERAGLVVAAAASGTGCGGGQDHYAVLGLPRSACIAEIKRAYRLLARKYHPDVSKDLQAGAVFKSIRYAYEVLSDEVSRAQYDMTLRFPDATERTWTRNQPDNFKDDERRRRMQRWAELKQRMQYQRQKNASSWYHQRVRYHESSRTRGPFIGVLRFTFLTLFLVKIIGYRASLTVCSLFALLDHQLDAGYKTGYVIAWFMGGRGGMLLSILIKFASWLCGKKNSNLVAVAVVAIWIGANLSRCSPLPQGAVLALLYMSIKLQVDLKQKPSP